ncbi:phage tail tip lysozyme [Paraburkholderia sp. RL18-085-BIA-A]|uniref:phage tail tip lysozyme n=1 Tax=Paraburkholderia sp. RL18-085-BIA-A TaxID=3031633 RepID=UPI0038BBC941
MAGTIVDALFVTLGLDPSGFLTGKKKAEDATNKLSAAEAKAQKELEARNKQAVDSFKKVRTEVLALLAIFTAGMGIKDFTEHTIGSAVQLGYMSKNLQMSTQDLSAWQRAAERSGDSAQGITTALQDSQQQIAKFKLGQVSDQMQAFFRFGGKVGDLKDANSYLLAQADIIHRIYQVDPGRARAVADMFGRGQDFDFIKQGAAGMLALRDAQLKNSAVTEKQATQALKLKNAWLDLRDRLTYVGTTVLLELIPVFETWLGKLQKMADWVADHKADISRWVDDAVTSMQKFVEWANKAADSVGGWKNVLIALAAIKVLSIVSPLLQLAAALTGVSGGLAAIALSGPGALLALGGLGAAAELARQSALDKAIPKGPNHDQQVADAMASGDGAVVVTPDAVQPPPGGFGKLGQWLKNSFGNSEAGRQKQAMDYLVSQGWTPAQSSGIVGSLTQESRVDPTSRNKTSGAYGIGQWLGSRVQDFQKWSGHALQTSTFQEQLAFMQYELTKGKEQAAGRRLRAAQTAEEAAAIHSQYYERPGAAEANVDKRQAYARVLYASVGQANADQAARQANATQIAGQVSAVRGPASTSNVSHTNTTTAETNINGPITIQTRATDAQGIAREFGKAVSKYSFTVPQANTGLA